MKQVKKRWPWHPKVPGEATVRNISKFALKIALFYSQTMSWEGCDVSLRRRRTVRYFYSFRQIFFLTPITVPRSVVGAGVVALHQCQHWWWVETVRGKICNFLQGDEADQRTVPDSGGKIDPPGGVKLTPPTPLETTLHTSPPPPLPPTLTF